ncbi:hypothetical protein BCR33DRAFT_371406 [Rhizoclosmatium globosum]|uniref:Uncharacterized protein n=1 Tax=Rhizoclosmatium globosum TaxID=329046 RepID=A0A1Y2BZS9_9FUNG|nr:hypothetical protein BCR33DRAFT_371406 [Rhizoclosmatium globosum]|eukprot:ORY40174.1 hypothetical protein BCR33DRAFT_371406 [Rhizoclosmatium globosum]
MGFLDNHSTLPHGNAVQFNNAETASTAFGCQQNRRAILLGQWIQKYTFEVGLFDILSMIPWVQIFQSSQYAYPLSFIRLLRFHRLAGMMSSNPFLRQIVHNIEGIGGVGAILSRQLMGFYSWNVQFDHWKYFGGNGIEGASVLNGISGC